MPTPRDHVVDYHQRMQNFTKRWLESVCEMGISIHCRARCARCCSVAVHTTYPEAELIAVSLDREQEQKLDDHVEKLLREAEDFADLRTYLRKHSEMIGPCPFLARDECCSVYEIRPLSCRALLSTRPPEWCAVDISRLDSWDRKLYEESLDIQVVAWPTHYVAATQDFAHHLESDLLTQQQTIYGWSLAGNLPLLVWLARSKKFKSLNPVAVKETIRELSLPDFLLTLTTEPSETTIKES